MKRNVLILLMIGMVGSVLIKADFSELISLLLNLNPFLLAVLLFMQIFTILFINIQWKMISCHIGRELPMSTIYHVNMLGNFFECITPSLKAGGEAVKVYILKSQKGYDFSNAVVLTGLQKSISILSFIIVNLVSLVILFFKSNDIYQILNIALPFVLLIMVLSAILYLFYNLSILSTIVKSIPINRGIQEKLLNNINSFKETLCFALKDKKFFIKQLILGLLIWLLFGVKAFIISESIGINKGIILVMVVTFIAYMAGMIPLLPGGLGTFEGTIILLLTTLGVSSGLSLTFAIVLRLITYWFVFFISLVYILFYGFYKGKISFSPNL